MCLVQTPNTDTVFRDPLCRSLPRFSRGSRPIPCIKIFSRVNPGKVALLEHLNNRQSNLVNEKFVRAIVRRRELCPEVSIVQGGHGELDLLKFAVSSGDFAQ